MTFNKVPVVKEKQVIVVGGGPAGIASAIASARNGASTILIERYGYLGGMASTGLPFLTFHDQEGRLVIKGIAREMIERLKSKNATMGDVQGKDYLEHRIPSTVTPVDPEEFKFLSMEMAEEAGVELRLHCWAFEVFKHQNSVEGVITLSKSGIEAIKGKIIIDCTGDGDLAVKAGAEYEQGRARDGKTQPPSLMFTVANVDKEKMKKLSSQQLYRMGERANKEGKLPETVARTWLCSLPQPGCVAVNGTRVHGVDATKVEDLTFAEKTARKQIKMTLKWLREEMPGFENCVLVNTASQMGIRESRRIKGEYILTEEDILEGREFDDAICRGSYSIDIHNPQGSDNEIIKVKGKRSYTIPYRTLVPLNIENFLVAGRCISATSEALGAIRVMAICMGIGQGAGTAAALATKNSVSVRNIDREELRKTLITQEVIL